jgi:hypothetical protein
MTRNEAIGVHTIGPERDERENENENLYRDCAEFTMKQQLGGKGISSE